MLAIRSFLGAEVEIPLFGTTVVVVFPLDDDDIAAIHLSGMHANSGARSYACGRILTWSCMSMGVGRFPLEDDDIADSCHSSKRHACTFGCTVMRMLANCMVMVMALKGSG